MKVSMMSLVVLMAATCAAAGGEMEIARRGMPPEAALVIPQPTRRASTSACSRRASRFRSGDGNIKGKDRIG